MLFRREAVGITLRLHIEKPGQAPEQVAALKVRLVDAANHSFGESQIVSHATNRHHFSQVYYRPRQALCAVAFRDHVGKNGVR